MTDKELKKYIKLLCDIWNIKKYMKKYFYKMWNNYLEYKERRAAYVVLRSMSDYTLKDIGLYRSDIRRQVFKEHDR